MTRKEWTTEAQWRFLHKRIPAVLAPKEVKSRQAKKTFMDDMLAAWDKKWPHHAPTDQEIDAERLQITVKGKDNKTRSLTDEEARAVAYAKICEPQFQVRPFLVDEPIEGPAYNVTLANQGMVSKPHP
jgi:hypothetical protein